MRLESPLDFFISKIYCFQNRLVEQYVQAGCLKGTSGARYTDARKPQSATHDICLYHKEEELLNGHGEQCWTHDSLSWVSCMDVSVVHNKHIERSLTPYAIPD